MKTKSSNVVNPETEQSIGRAIVLEQLDEENQSQGDIGQAKHLDSDDDWQLASTKDECASEAVEPPDSERSSRRYWLCGLVSVFILGIAEITLFTIDMYQSQDWLGGLWLVALASILAVSVKWGVSEWFGLKQLKQQQKDKLAATSIFNSPAIGQGRSFCTRLAKNLPAQRQADLVIWQQSIEPHHNDKEVLSLFEQHVLVQADKQALQHVSANASASAAMIAVSPFALLDMAIVLWRNVKMLNNISQSYGVKLGYWGRVALVRSVFKTMLYAGASEIIADAGNYALGAGLTGKLSARLGQGAGAGVLTARIGIKAMQSCRPVPWLASTKPGLNKISAQLIEDLKKHVL